MTDTIETKGPEKISPALEAFNAAVAAVAMTPGDEAKAARIAASGAGIRFEVITPGVAKALLINHNTSDGNRSLSLAKVGAYRAMMSRGEWKKMHQGIAFYPTTKLGDGQHRLAACALSGVTIELSVMSDLDLASIIAIDRAKPRNSGEWLEMSGVRDGKLKAVIAKSSVEYTVEVDTGIKPVLSDEQVASFVISHNPTCSAALEIGRLSHDNVVNPVMSIRQAANVALLMIMGGYAEQRVKEFMACVQTGQASFPESPTSALSARLFKALKSKRIDDRVSGKNFLALALEAAALWEQRVSATRLNVNTKKAVPSYRRPEVPAELAAAE